MSNAVEHALFVFNLKEFLNIRPWIQDTGNTIPVSRQGDIQFTHVSFSYPGSSRLILSDISLHIKPGETVAVVGENGAGKTTLAKLIARLYEPDQGYIALDGMDIRQLPVAYLHSQLTFVLQGFGRYEATAADNIAYGDWRRLLHDQDQVEAIAREANIQEMIEGMPQTYGTMLGKMFGGTTCRQVSGNNSRWRARLREMPVYSFWTNRRQAWMRGLSMQSSHDFGNCLRAAQQSSSLIDFLPSRWPIGSWYSTRDASLSRVPIRN